MRTSSLVLATLLLTPAAATAGPSPSGRPTGYVVVPPEQLTTANGAEISKVIYLNRCTGGCTISAGPNDARNDTSSVVDGTTFLSEFNQGDQVWADMLTCLREVYAPFDVEFTEIDPSPMFHHEAIVAGLTAELGMPGVLGVAPISCGSPLNNVISFSLANSHGPDAQHLCWTVAQESAHAFGLDHEFDCHDPMTYIPGCGQKYFRDEAFSCGRDQVEPCICGGAAQNSHRKLLTVFGTGPGVDPPMLEIQLPDDGGTVVDGFSVYALATDTRGNKRAELRINGYKWIDKDADELFVEQQLYQFSAPDSLPDGYQNIEVRAYNDLEVTASATVQVLKGAPCTGAGTCLDGQSCNDGACAWPAPTADIGEECARNQDCISDLCPSNGGEQLCSQDCTPTVTGSCPMDFDCLAVGGGAGVCWPAGGGGGCCSLGGQRTGWAQLALFVAVILLVSTRRRRPA